MPITCDFISDKNPAIMLHLHNAGLIPDYVQNSQHLDAESVEGLNKVAFAVPAQRLYPCHTKAACWQSAAHFIATNQDDEEAGEYIVKMADHHDIVDDVNALVNFFDNQFTKAASEEAEEPVMEKFALTLDLQGHQGRGVENFYPITEPWDIMESAQQALFDYSSAKLPLTAFRDVACNMTKAASSLGMDMRDLPGAVLQLGTPRVPDPHAAYELVTMRAHAGIDPTPYQEMCVDLGAAMTKVASIEEAIELAEQTAAQMCELDAEAGLVRYSNNFPDPYAILFTGPTPDEMMKYAAETVTINQVHVPVADFLNLSDNVIETNFNSDTGNLIKLAKATATEFTQDLHATGKAEEYLNQLPDDARNHLLQTLATTAW